MDCMIQCGYFHITPFVLNCSGPGPCPIFINNVTTPKTLEQLDSRSPGQNLIPLGNGVLITNSSVCGS